MRGLEEVDRDRTASAQLSPALGRQAPGQSRPSQARPAAALSWLFVGYPLWWLLGIAPVATLVASVALALELVRRRHVRRPRLFWVWALFLVWVLIGLLVVQVDAPFSITGTNPNRYLTWAFRLVWYLQATVLFLYVGNIRDAATWRRVRRAFSWMFVWTVVGGLAGTLLPHLSFPSLVELVLPVRLSSMAFVRSLIHPNLVELVNITASARPSAPFPFANVWGLNFACFLPFFVRTWFEQDAGWRRWAAVPVLLLAVVPVVFSLNRGLWAALVVTALVLAVRAVVTGHLRYAAAIVAMLAVIAAVIWASPLRSTIESRLESSVNSNAGRSALAFRGFDSVWEKSPLVGFGTTRDVQGSLSSIAGGATTTCPRCSPPSFGTQGQIFLTTFSQGFVGAGFYVAFLLILFFRSFRIRGPDVTAAVAVVSMHLVTFAAYSADNLALFPILAAAAVLWRAESRARGEQRRDRRDRRVMPRRWQVPLSAVTIAASVVVAAAWHDLHDSVTYSVSVLVPDASDSGDRDHMAVSLDSIAVLAHGRGVERADERAVGEERHAAGSPALTVTAQPNTRVVNLAYTATTTRAARRACAAAAKELLRIRADQLSTERTAPANSVGLPRPISVPTLSSLDLPHPTEPAAVTAASPVPRLPAFVTTLLTPDDRTAAGRIVRPPHPVLPTTPWALPVADGLAVGVILALALGWCWERRPRARK